MDELGGSAPSPTIIGRGAPFCPEGKPLKTSRLSHWQVLTPRLLGLTPSAGRKKPHPVSNHHDHRKTYVSAPRGVLDRFPRNPLSDSGKAKVASVSPASHLTAYVAGACLPV